MRIQFKHAVFLSDHLERKEIGFRFDPFFKTFFVKDIKGTYFEDRMVTVCSADSSCLEKSLMVI